MKFRENLLKKYYGIPALLLLLAAGAVGASIVVWTFVTEPITVAEPFTITSTLPSSFSMFAGESRSYTITVSNAANVPIKATIDYSIDADFDGDGVSVDVSVTVTPMSWQDVPAGGEVIFTIEIKAAADSPVGEVSIDWAVERG